MEIIFLIKGKISEKDWDCALGSYSIKNDTATIHLGRIWNDTKDFSNFDLNMANTLIHESLHSVIMPVCRIDNLNLKGLELTKNEWIVRKLLEQKMDEFTLTPYIVDDVYLIQLDKALEESKRLTKKIIKYLIISIICLLTFSLLLTFFIKWLVEYFSH